MKTISDRLKWLNPNNKNQMNWLRMRFEKSHDMSGFARRNRRESDKSFKTLLENQWIEDSKSEPDRINQQISQLRNAWNNYNKENKNTSFSLSDKARKQLDEIAKQENKPRYKIVEALILRAKDLDKLELELIELIDEIDGQGEALELIYKIQSLHSILSVDRLIDEIEILRLEKHLNDLKIKDYDNLKLKLAKIENENRELKATIELRRRRDERLI